MLLLIFLTKLVILCRSSNVQASKVNILMPNVTTNKEDAYMCVSYKLQDDQQYIIGIEPLTNMQIAHHMFAYGCEKPGVSTDRAWQCGQVCEGEKSILFAWGRNAPSLNLPQDVAFKIGTETNIRYIVINIHYLDKVSNDQSGLLMSFSNKPRKYQAGISLMVSGYIDIPPKTKSFYSDLSCKYDGPTINVFAYRVHAHAHGDVNTAYRVRNHKWDMIAKGDPQWPQAFYPTDQLWSLQNDDILVGRCKYHNDENRHVYAGSTHTDEMCNIYLMYYYDSKEKTLEFTCAGNAYPQLESIIPNDADLRPEFPGIQDNYHSHHDMHSGQPLDKSQDETRDNKFTLINDWYDKKKISFGQVGGIALSDDFIYIFHRGSQIWQQDSFNGEYKFNVRKYPLIKEDTILVLDRLTGELIKSFGSETYLMPHGINIDSNGNVWTTDVGLHQIIKYSNDKVVLELGERGEPGRDRGHFCQPSDVAILSNGDFFVSDGYCNSRVIKFDSKGNYLAEWSSEEHGKPGHFFVPHALALHESSELVCVADRENKRVQCFDLLGNFMFQSSSDSYGPIYGVAFASSNSSVLYALNGFNTARDKQHERRVFLIETKHGSLTGEIELNQNIITTPHNIKVSANGTEIYISHLNPPDIFKFCLLNINKSSKNSSIVTLGALDPDKENFRTSMFIMAFLAVPVLIISVVALLVRLNNMNKLNWFKNRRVESWLTREHFTKKKSNRVVNFTRLRNESDDEKNPLEVTDSSSDELETMNIKNLSSA